MHYYKFNIGDYSSHTQHLSESEDLAYRRMLDYCYLNEIGLPKSVEDIARLIRMRTHSDCIANVLREYFTETKDGFINQRCEIELFDYKSKSEKAKDSAKARWRKSNENNDANAMRTQCEGNAKHKPLTINQEPLNSLLDAKASSQNHVAIIESKEVSKTKKEKNTLDKSDLIKIGFDEQIGQDFITLRNAKNLPLTVTALKSIISAGKECSLNPNETLLFCIESNWGGFKVDWFNNANKNKVEDLKRKKLSDFVFDKSFRWDGK